MPITRPTVYHYNYQALDEELQYALMETSEQEDEGLSTPINTIIEQLDDYTLVKYNDLNVSFVKFLSALRQWEAYIDTRCFSDENINEQDIIDNYKNKIFFLIEELKSKRKSYNKIKKIEIVKNIDNLVDYYTKALNQSILSSRARLAVVTNGGRPRYLKQYAIQNIFTSLIAKKDNNQNHIVGCHKIQKGDKTYPMYFKFMTTLNQSGNNIAQHFDNDFFDEIATGTEQARLELTKQISPQKKANACVSNVIVEFSAGEVTPGKVVLQHSLGMGNMSLDEFVKLIDDNAEEIFVFDNICEELIAAWLAVDTDGKKANYRATVEYNENDKKYHVMFHNIDADKTLKIARINSYYYPTQKDVIQNEFNNILLTILLYYKQNQNIEIPFDTFKNNISNKSPSELLKGWLLELNKLQLKKNKLASHFGDHVDFHNFANLKYAFKEDIIENITERLKNIVKNITSSSTLLDLFEKIDPLTLQIYQFLYAERKCQQLYFNCLVTKKDYEHAKFYLKYLQKHGGTRDSCYIPEPRELYSDNYIHFVMGIDDEVAKANEKQEFINTLLEHIDTCCDLFCREQRDESQPSLFALLDFDKHRNENRRLKTKDSSESNIRMPDIIEDIINSANEDSRLSYAFSKKNNAEYESSKFLLKTLKDDITKRNNISIKKADFLDYDNIAEFWPDIDALKSVHLENVDLLIDYFRNQISRQEPLDEYKQALFDKIIPYTAINDWQTFVEFFPEDKTYLSNIHLFKYQKLFKELKRTHKRTSYQNHVLKYLTYCDEQRKKIKIAYNEFILLNEPDGRNDQDKVNNIIQLINSIDFSYSPKLLQKNLVDKEYYHKIFHMLKELANKNKKLVIQNFPFYEDQDFAELKEKENVVIYNKSSKHSTVAAFSLDELIAQHERIINEACLPLVQGTDKNTANFFVLHDLHCYIEEKSIEVKKLAENSVMSVLSNDNSSKQIFDYYHNYSDADLEYKNNLHAYYSNISLTQACKNIKQLTQTNTARRRSHMTRVIIASHHPAILKNALLNNSGQFINHFTGKDLFYLLDTLRMSQENLKLIFKQSFLVLKLKNYIVGNPKLLADLLEKLESDQYKDDPNCQFIYKSLGFLFDPKENIIFRASKLQIARLSFLSHDMFSLQSHFVNAGFFKNYGGKELYELIANPKTSDKMILTILKNDISSRQLFQYCNKNPESYEKLLDKMSHFKESNPQLMKDIIFNCFLRLNSKKSFNIIINNVVEKNKVIFISMLEKVEKKYLTQHALHCFASTLLKIITNDEDNDKYENVLKPAFDQLINKMDKSTLNRFMRAHATLLNEHQELTIAVPSAKRRQCLI